MAAIAVKKMSKGAAEMARADTTYSMFVTLLGDLLGNLLAYHNCC
jgi:hypothetical protein